MTTRQMMLSAGLAAMVGAGGLVAAGSAASGAETPAARLDVPAQAAFDELFEQSLAEKKGITLYVGSQTIPGIVTRIGNEVIELRNQQFPKILVRRDEIAAVALH